MLDEVNVVFEAQRRHQKTSHVDILISCLQKEGINAIAVIKYQDGNFGRGRVITYIGHDQP